MGYVRDSNKIPVGRDGGRKKFYGQERYGPF